jgi:predicted nucleic-acid-binding Zn-ribbon protein
MPEDLRYGLAEVAMRLRPCPKCHGTLFLEADVLEGFLLSKCLQCGFIESYYWLERTTQALVPLPLETEAPVPEP